MSTLTVPEPAPGLDVVINYETRQTLNALGIYLNAIDFMYQLAQKGWNERLDGGLTVWVEGYDVQVDVDSLYEVHSSFGLEYNHIVFALWKTMLDVAAKSRFCTVLSTIWLRGRILGTLRIRRLTPTTLEGRVNVTNFTDVNATQHSNDITYPSGQYNDPDDTDFSMQYTYSGSRINSKSIFLTVLDALAASAQFSPIASLGTLYAVGPAGDCVISVVPTEHPFAVNYSFVTKALRLMISDIMVKLKKFGGITLQLKWEGGVIAQAQVTGHYRAVGQE